MLGHIDDTGINSQIFLSQVVGMDVQSPEMLMNGCRVMPLAFSRLERRVLPLVSPPGRVCHYLIKA